MAEKDKERFQKDKAAYTATKITEDKSDNKQETKTVKKLTSKRKADKEASAVAPKPGKKTKKV